MTRTLLTLVAALALLACGSNPQPPAVNDGGPTDAGGTTDAGSVDDGGAPDAGLPPSDGGLPIVAPSKTWTWVDFPETRCVRGTPTGLGINPNPDSTDLLIFVQGGGSCDLGTGLGTCWSPDHAGTPTQYGAAEFAVENLVGNSADHNSLWVLDRASRFNPFAAANIVFIPYCTGDEHGGAVTQPDGPNLTYYWGATDMEQFLARLVPTFPNVKRVFLMGTSAGGAGTQFNFDRVHHAFQVRTDIIDDSAPPLPGDPRAHLDALAVMWGIKLPPGCADCSTLPKLYAYNRATASGGSAALISYAYDSVISQRLYGTPTDNPNWMTDFNTGLLTFVDSLASDPKAKAFIVDNQPDTASHVPTNSKYVTSLGPWLSALVQDSDSWATTHVAYKP